MASSLNTSISVDHAAHVQFVDALLKVASKNESQGEVQWSKDWETIKFMFKGFEVLYPKSAEDFNDKMNRYRANNHQSHSILKEDQALIQHQLEVPKPFYQMMKVIFPKQDWNKDFVNDLAKHLPQFKTSDSL